MGTSTSFRTDVQVQGLVEVLFPVFATLGVLVRLGLRHRYKIALQWDDALIVLSVGFAWGLWGVWYYTTVNLIGNREMALRPTTPPLLQKLCMAMDFFYGEGVNVVKFALLYFYHRAFGTNPNATMARVGIWSIAGVVGLFTIARAVETVFVCPPMCFGDERPFSLAAWQISMRAINWITEFAILLFPVPILWGMMISTKRKIGIYICFFLGIITCAAGAARLAGTITIYQARNTVAWDATTTGESEQQEWFYSYYIPQMSQMTLWALAELNVGIITATLPAIRSPAITLTKSAVRKIRASIDASNMLSSQENSSPTNTMVSNSTTLLTANKGMEKKGMSLMERELV